MFWKILNKYLEHFETFWEKLRKNLKNFNILKNIFETLEGIFGSFWKLLKKMLVTFK